MAKAVERGRGKVGSKDERQKKAAFHCHYCRKPCHEEAYCWKKKRDEATKARFAENTEEKSELFVAICSETKKPNDVWFWDSGCSNHMSGRRSSLMELDESKKSEMTIGDNKKIQVEGRRTVSITTRPGKTDPRPETQTERPGSISEPTPKIG